MQEYGVGDGVPETEIKEIQKYDSDPPLYYVTIGDEQVEVESQDLHEPDRFSLKCLEQINQAMPPVGKLIWRKAINKLLKEHNTDRSTRVYKDRCAIKRIIN